MKPESRKGRVAGVLTGVLLLLVLPASGQIVISQVYGAGGNSGANWNADYVELLNRGTAAVDVTGWSIQYAATTGTSWSRAGALSGTIQPGRYYLARVGAVGVNGSALPTPDFTSTSLSMSATAGKIALVNNNTTITAGTSCPSGSTIVDFVGYGTSTNCYEGSGPTASLNATTAAFRLSGGCIDTNNNAANFVVATAAPRNSATAPNVCYHTVTFVAGAHGSLTGTTPQTVNYGANCTAVTAVPDLGYHFTGWTGGYVGTNNPLTVTNVTADMTITANFAIDTHTVTFVAGAHGSLTGTTPQTVNYGADCTAVTAVADLGYHFTGWTGDYVGSDNPLTVTNVTADLTITANFAIDTHTVTFVAGAHGSLTGTTPQTVIYGADCTAVTAVADLG